MCDLHLLTQVDAPQPTIKNVEIESRIKIP